MENNSTDRPSFVPVAYGRGAGPPSTELYDPEPEWDSEEIHLRDYLDVILRRKWLIISTLLLTFVTALIFTLAQPKLYSASATIQVTEQDQKVTKFEEVVSSNMRYREFYDTQVDLLKSREMARRVVERLMLADDPAVIELVFGDGEPSLTARVKGMVKELIVSFIPAERRGEAQAPLVDAGTLREMAMTGFITGGLTVTPSRNTTLIDIAFMSSDRALSRKVVDGLTQEFVRWNMEKKLDASDLARGFLMKQIDRAKISLEKAEEDLNRFAQQAGIVSLDSRQNSVYRQLEELNSALALAESDMISKQALFKQAEKDGPEVLPEVMTSTLVGELKSEYARLRAEYEKQSVTFQDDYPAVRALLGRMNSIAGRIGEEEQKIFRTVRNRYEAAAENLAVLQKRVEQQAQLAMELNERTTQYKIMEREVQTNKQIYQSLLERSREIESMAGISSSNIHIINAAALPLVPAKPNVRRNLLLAVVLGLFAGVGLAFFLEYFTDQIANPDEISERFHIPILGVMPLVKKVDGGLEKSFVDDPHSAFAEALRTTRVSLQLSGAGSKSRSFVITSTRPDEGKTTLAVNLALTFAAVGEQVVLVDADMRRPCLHKIFTPPEGQGGGLSSFLAGGSGSRLICKDGVPNLRYIPAGPVPPNPVELLASRRLGLLVKELEKHFDRVIIDGPPMQGFADTLVLSRSVGGVVLVSSVGETTREALRHFRKNILNVNSSILGCIINKVDLTRRYGYNSYYKYYGYYRYNTQDEKKKQDTARQLPA